MHRGIAFASDAKRAEAEEHIGRLSAAGVKGLSPLLADPDPPKQPTVSASTQLRVLLRLGGLRRRNDGGATSKWKIASKHFRMMALSIALNREAESRKHFLRDVAQQHLEQKPAEDEEDMYSLENLDKRYGLRHEPRVAKVLQEWWKVVQRFLRDEGKNETRVEEQVTLPSMSERKRAYSSGSVPIVHTSASSNMASLKASAVRWSGVPGGLLSVEPLESLPQSSATAWRASDRMYSVIITLYTLRKMAM